MYGFFAVFGDAARLFDKEHAANWWRDHGAVTSVVVDTGDAYTIMARPAGVPLPRLARGSAEFSVVVEGYVLAGGLDAAAPVHEHHAAFARIAARDGIERAFDDLKSANCAVLAFDTTNQQYFAATDEFGWNSVYYAAVPGGVVVSTHPVAIAELAQIDNEFDYTASAEWLLFGYPLAGRQMLRGVRAIRPASILRWDQRSGELSVGFRQRRYSNVLPDARHYPSPEEAAELFEQACRRLAALPYRPANLQSAGLDSRLILASWPGAEPLPCYTYGAAGTLEVDVARQVAEARGSAFHHAVQHGDEVADSLDGIFRMNGALIFPSRYLIARTIASDGYTAVIDGLAGDIYLGGSQYKTFPFMASPTSSALARFRDFHVSRADLERLTHDIYKAISHEGKLDSLAAFLSADFLAEVRRRKPQVVEELHGELERLLPANGSLAVLWRNFNVENRMPATTGQQGVMCRAFLEVLFPFTSDRPLMEACLRIPPEVTAYNRYYLKLYRRRFPRYARILSGNSMLPLTYGPVAQRLWKYAMKKTGLAERLCRTVWGVSSTQWELWPGWFSESAALRGGAERLLTTGGIQNPDTLSPAMGQAHQAGSKGLYGRIFHMAAMSQWMSLARRSPELAATRL